ncbi:MAG: carboxypeptidase regulatory-like domain-containing protein [Thermoanaerobaculia bacterium]
MNAFLFLWLLLSSSLPSAPGEQWRLVYRDGTVEALQAAPLLSQERREDVSSAWAWSDGAAPRRIEVDRIGRQRLIADRARLQVHVPGAQALAGARVIAGPLQMWEEVPEGLMPSWPVPRDGRLALPLEPGQPWRLRLAGKGKGTWWIDLPRGQTSLTLAPVPAPDVDLLVTGQDGQPLEGSWMRVLEGAQGRRGGPGAWAFHRAEQGRISAPGLPDAEEVVAILRAPEYAPAILRGRPSDFPRLVKLRSGAALTGRFTDEDGQPVAGAKVHFESWVTPDVAGLTRTAVETAGDGTWKVAGLPVGATALLAQARGFAPYRSRLDLKEGRTDLGTARLRRGKPLRLAVVDDLGAPVAGALVGGGMGSSAYTDRKGLAVLPEVDPEAALDLSVRASRYLPWQSRIEPPLPSSQRIEMTRAFTVTGRLLGPEGSPVDEGLAVLRRGSLSSSMSLQPGGGFELDLPPGVGAELTLSSPATRELRVTLEAGLPGEVRDLGALRAPPGVEIVGRITSADNGGPVAGARVWLPRPSESGSLMAWADRDLLQATSAADGSFRLTGAPNSPLQLRIDAAGFARAYQAIPPAETGGALLDVGEVPLVRGATLRVLFTGEPDEGAVARADLRGDWLEMDMLSAPVSEGAAVFRNVPPGQLRVTVQRGQTLLCERDVTVPPAEEEVEAECSDSAVRVRGTVVVGGRPAGPGTLVWMAPAPQSPGRITDVISPGGLRQQQVLGQGRPQVEVAVAQDGSFFTDELTPGGWQVSWVPVSGSLGEPRSVEVPALPAGSEYEAILTFPGGALAGIVLDPENRPAEGARVRDLGTGAVAFTGADGSFVLTGAAPGKHSIQAERDELASPVADTEVVPDRPGDLLRLVLGERQDPEIRVLVLDAEGVPVAGAFVFLEEEGKGQRLLTAGLDGRVAARIEHPLPVRVRFAALANGTWSLGEWKGWSEVQETMTLLARPGGAVRVESASRTGSPRILSSQGWDVSWLLTRLGVPPTLAPGVPIELHGLPEGDYTVSLVGTTSPAKVRAGRQVVVVLD